MFHPKYFPEILFQLRCILSSDGLHGTCTLEKTTVQSLKEISVKIKLKERGGEGFRNKNLWTRDTSWQATQTETQSFYQYFIEATSVNPMNQLLTSPICCYACPPLYSLSVIAIPFI